MAQDGWMPAAMAAPDPACLDPGPIWPKVLHSPVLRNGGGQGLDVLERLMKAGMIHWYGQQDTSGFCAWLEGSVSACNYHMLHDSLNACCFGSSKHILQSEVAVSGPWQRALGGVRRLPA